MELKLPKRIRNHVNPLSELNQHEFAGFDNENPIIVDIGAYRGEFSQKLEEKFGDKYNYLVCEIRKPYARYLEKLFVGKKHVRVFDGDSSRGLRKLLEPSIKKGINVEYIFINFPDPWFKAKHHKRRQLSPYFLEDIKKWLPNSTKVIFQTDQKELFNDTKQYLDDAALDYKEFAEPLWGIQSYWEEMKAGEGSSINRLVFSI